MRLSHQRQQFQGERRVFSQALLRLLLPPPPLGRTWHAVPRDGFSARMPQCCCNTLRTSKRTIETWTLLPAPPISSCRWRRPVGEGINSDDNPASSVSEKVFPGGSSSWEENEYEQKRERGKMKEKGVLHKIH